MNVETVVDSIIENYTKYLCFMKNLGFKMYAWAPVASQPDCIEISKKYPRYGSMQDRNKATLYFSKALKQKCEQLGIGVMSIAEELVDLEGNTKIEYYSKDGVHLSQSAKLIAEEEWKRYGF